MMTRLLIAYLILTATQNSCAMQDALYTFKESVNRYNRNTQIYYAFDNGSYAGSICWDTNAIITLDVAPKWRNQGLGAHLFCTILNRIKLQNHDYAYWYASGSVAYFRRFGAQLVALQHIKNNSGPMVFDFEKHGDPAGNQRSFRDHFMHIKGDNQ